MCFVDGGYMEWIEYGLCFVMCGKGIRIRMRICINLRLSDGGKFCDEFFSEYIVCDEGVCLVI